MPKNEVNQANKRNGVSGRRVKMSLKLPKFLRIILTPLIAIGRYFKESWNELKQVRWPNRRSTWAMMFAVLLFSGFFVALIKVLDIGFDELFNLVIK